MEASLTRATKLHSIPKLLDKLNALGSPRVQPIHGEGSSFLSLPTKRNVRPTAAATTTTFDNKEALGATAENPNATLDFQRALLEHVLLRAESPVLNSFAGESSIGGTRRPSYEILDDVQVTPTIVGVPTEAEWYTLNQLRVHAGAPERSEQGVQKLMQYYAQLCWLEDCFPFATGKYEKAAVMWNIGAIYSQMGSMQSLWTPEGLKRASKYFQKAAGAFVHIRDHLFPRFKVQIDPSSDLCEFSLAAASELMLAQATECFYQKAEYDNTSSPVTSQISAQAADFYDIAYKAAKQANSFGKYRFPKTWTSHIHAKHLIYTAIAHFHSPNYCAQDEVVGERHARLLLAKEIVELALEKCVAKEQGASPEIRVLAANVRDKIDRVLDAIEKANYETFHQTKMTRERLHPVRRPPHSLVHRIDVVRGVGCGSVWDGIRQGKIRFALEGSIHLPLTNADTHRPSSVMAMMPSTLAHMEAPPEVTPHSRASMVAGVSSIQSLQLADMERVKEGGRGNSVSQSMPVFNEVVKFAAETRQLTQQWVQQLTAYHAKIAAIQEQLETSMAVAPLSVPIQQSMGVKEKAEQMLKHYKQCEAIDAKQPTLEIFDRLVKVNDWISVQLQELNAVVADGGDVESKVKNCGVHSAIEARAIAARILDMKVTIQKMTVDWTTGNENDQDENTQSVSVDPLLDGVRELRVKSIELMTQMEEEAFGELFSGTGTTANTNDLHWSVSKIITVLPCLSDVGRKDRTQLEAELSQTLEYFQKYPLVGEDGLFLGFNRLVSEVARLPQSLHAHRQDVERLLEAMKQESACWSVVLSNGHELSVEGLQVVEQLAAMGKRDLQCSPAVLASELEQTPDTISFDNFVRLGIESKRNDLKRAVSQGLAAESKYSPLVCQFEKQSVAGFLQNIHQLSTKIQQAHKMDMESDKIVATFDEQLDKWAAWRGQCMRCNNHLESVQSWLLQKFCPLVSASASGTGHRPHRLDTRRGSSAKDLFASTQALNKMVTENMDLEKRQVANAEKIATCVVEDCVKVSVPPVVVSLNPGVYGNARAPQQQHPSQQVAHGGLRQQMLRQLSMTAAAIEKQSKEIETTSALTPSQSKEELRQQQLELSRQLKHLQEQQREFFKLYKQASAPNSPQTQRKSMDNGNGAKTGTAMKSFVGGLVGRPSMALQGAKDKLMTFLRRPAAANLCNLDESLYAPDQMKVYPATAMETSHMQSKRSSVAKEIGEPSSEIPPPSAPTLRVDDLLRENQELRSQLMTKSYNVPLTAAIAAAPKFHATSRRASCNRKPVNQELVQEYPMPRPVTPYRTSMYDDDHHFNSAVEQPKTRLDEYLAHKNKSVPMEKAPVFPAVHPSQPKEAHRYPRSKSIAKSNRKLSFGDVKVMNQSTIKPIGASRRTSHHNVTIADEYPARPATTTTTITISTSGVPASHVQVVDSRRGSGLDIDGNPIDVRRKSVMASPTPRDASKSARGRTPIAEPSFAHPQRRSSSSTAAAVAPTPSTKQMMMLSEFAKEDQEVTNHSWKMARRMSQEHGDLPRVNLRDRMESVSKYLAWNRGFEGEVDGHLTIEPYIP